MGKGKPRAVEKGVLGPSSSSLSSSLALDIPPGPVFYPNETEFEDPLEYIYKIRPEAEPYGICRIVPPKNWKPPFALDLDKFTFQTKTQAIHQLQARPPSCDSKTFELEYTRFLEDHGGGSGKKKRVIFDGKELDLCKLFNGVKRYGGYEKVVKDKKWGEVFRFLGSAKKISQCSKHVLCQLYREHLFDYEKYYNGLNRDTQKSCKAGMQVDKDSEEVIECSSYKRRRRNSAGERVEVRKIEKLEERDQICEQCTSGLHGELMLLCDRCNKGWHIYCLSPPLKKVPIGNWYCMECLNSDKDSFGFVPGKHFSMEAFRRMADRAKKKWFGSSETSRVSLEKKFWEIVEGSVGEVEVRYGSDLDTSVYGSGFPRINDQRPKSVEVDVWDEYAASPWNLNNLPKLKGSMLRAVYDSIAGVMVPWLYIGMLFSSFCWHFEDHCFYSMNYLHWGEPKCWYSVPGSEANAFEKVMRNTLPDLFDAQPDLLFQLVTMLNPSVLQENHVPVYSVLQEPGNFVITFPRSFHGGFNFGLNCAEAVNFAPADWLPHGGIGAELYQQYHKSAVLSHDELLCVIAKANCDDKVSPYLKKELLRTYTKEKTWRERLWRVGVVNSSPMSPRKHPEYVGTEEDPTCIICQQYLYLSAVACRCRPSAFVCLEHWEHLCECKPRRRRLLYRHTLAELNGLILITDKYNCEETTRNRSLRRQLPSCEELSILTKKVKSGHVTFAQRAEEWLLRSCNLFQSPYSRDTYTNALKEAEQFLWAGSEMEPVRDVVKNLIEAQIWADEIRDCLSKAENWSCHSANEVKKVCLEHVEKLLSCIPVPCNEPGHLKLKKFAEEARALSQESDSVCSSVSISELEVLYSKGSDLPFSIKEIEKIGQKLSFAKAWMDNVRKCISDKGPATIGIDFLYKLKSEMLELQVQVPETEMFLELLRQAESCQIRCCDVLRGPMSLKNVEVFLQEIGIFTIIIPELELLKQYHSDAVSWISHFNGLLVNIHEQEDQKNIVLELNSIMKEGALLKIQVDELPLVEIELKKACSREKALMARGTKATLEFLQQILTESVILQIDREKLFVDVAGLITAAMQWEERARHILTSESQMLEFEDALRSAEDIHAFLPSLDDVKDAVSIANSWLKNAEPFLASASSTACDSSPLLKVEALKVLISESEFVKISLEEKMLLQTVERNCLEWVRDASSLLEDTDCLFNTNDGNGVTDGLILKIETLVTSIESVIKAGVSLGFEFNESLKLQEACSSLKWCTKALSFCYDAPPLKEVEISMKAAEHIPVIWASGSLCSSLIEGVGWLGKAAKVVPVPVSGDYKSCRLSDVEDILYDFQRLKLPFPVMVDHLSNTIGKHKLWLEKVHVFFNLKSGERSWSQLLQLKEIGKSDAFSCSELDRLHSEVKKVEKWLWRCKDIVGLSSVDPLFEALLKVESTLDRSMYLYEKSMGCKLRDLCMLCSGDSADQEFLSCSICCERYHLQCLGPIQADKHSAVVHKCPYCQFVESGSVSWNGGTLLRAKGKRPELKKLLALLSESGDFVVRMEERDKLQEVVDKAIACKTCLTEVVDCTLAYYDKDLSFISRKLTIALKAIIVAGVFDYQSNCNLDTALARNAWRVRSNKLLEGSIKPVVQQIQQHMKEGTTIRIPQEDHYWKEITELKRIGLQWADIAKKVAVDSGALELDKVFELIVEGEKLPIHFEKELKLLKTRSMLYCICRKPYDQRAMIACDLCDEWYHFDCINLSSPPKTYICPACKPDTEELLTSSSLNQDRSTVGAKFSEPKTPSPQNTEPRKRKKTKRSPKQKMALESTDNTSVLQNSSGISRLLWRNRKPFRRTARKRTELASLSPFLHIQQQI